MIPGDIWMWLWSAWAYSFVVLSVSHAPPWSKWFAIPAYTLGLWGLL